MRLRNRITKATFWTDPDLLRWPRDKRQWYHSLWACADDSACIEDDMFGVKVAAWASPMDADMTVEVFEHWRDDLIAQGKLVPYEAGGKRYLYIPTMAEHERPRNPQEPDYPLPAWVKYQVTGEGRARRVTYVHGTVTIDTPYSDCTPSPVLPCPALPGTARSSVQPPAYTAAAFEEAWEGYPIHTYKAQALAEWKQLVAGGTDQALLVQSCKAAPRDTRQPLRYYLADGAWRDHLPRPRPEPRPCYACNGTKVFNGGACPVCQDHEAAL